VMVALVFLFGVTLAAPFFSITEAPLGFFIILFGLWEAWRLTRVVAPTIEGPFRVTQVTAEAV
jgi:hypothetical protein